MSDPAHDKTDQLLAEMTERIYEIYEQAAFEMKTKAEKYMDWFKETDRKKRQQWHDGEISDEEYRQWRGSHLLTGDRWLDMADVLAADMVHSGEIAASVINGYQPEVYAENHNYETYRIEHKSMIETSYTLYNAQAVERLVRDHPELFPIKAVANVPKLERWNMELVRSAMTQSILQGETMEEIADRLSQTVTTRNRNAALRDARTMTTSTENGGRMDAMRRAEEMGIKLKKGWLATLDGRTRHSHRLVDGEIVELNEEFSNGCMFPGDPNADPREVYNCRCRLLENITEEQFTSMPRHSRLGSMSYDEWKGAHSTGTNQK